MTDLDLERLGDVWRQQPDPKELEELRRAADMVRRRARLAQVVDMIAATVVAGVVIFLVLSNPQFDTLLVGGAAILVLLASNRRNRRLRREELRALTGTSEQMLDQTIGRIETSLRHSRYTLLGMGPAFFVGWLVASSAGRSVGSVAGMLSDDPVFRALWVGVAVAVIVAIAIGLVINVRRKKRELARLVAMREFYRDERNSTGP